MSVFVCQELITGWEFKKTDDEEEWLPVAKVPTVVHMDLMSNHKLELILSTNVIISNLGSRIPDTSQGMNEHQAIWVGEARWSYKCSFRTPPTEEGTRIALVFEGLDTFAKVQLNGIDVLTSENMFISHRIDITSLALPFNSLNELQIDFDSALVRGKEIMKEHPEHNYNARQGGLERIGVRKAQYHWGWDWGPKYMTAGPWRPVRLETYTYLIEDLSIEYTLAVTLDGCRGIISAQIDGYGECMVQLSLHDSNGVLAFSKKESVVAADYSVQVPFALQAPALWYPHGYGCQPIYTLSCRLFVDDSCVHTLVKKIGFRKAELVQEEDQFGKSFYFRVNGIDIFAGGSCWIPADNFIPRLTSEKYRQWMMLMVESNQIMIRYSLIPSKFRIGT
jgi:beta-mannosidase